MMQPNLFEPQKWAQLRELRERQAKAIDGIRQAIREKHKRIIVQGPCGFGKTLVAAHLVEGCIRKGKRPLFTCPAISLIDQTLLAFEADGIRDIGVIQAQHERTDWTAQVQIASVQTLIRRALPEVDLVIVDECHLQWAKLNERLDSDEWKDKIVIGLSATPWAKGMGLRWTKLIVAATTAELEAEGLSSPVRVYVPPDGFKPDISKLKTVAGDYEEKAASAIMSDQVLVGDVVDTWKRLGTGRKTFMFGVDRAHAQTVQKAFQDAGYPWGYIDNETSADERKEIFKQYRADRILGISSVGCLILGVDEYVLCLIDACLTKSLIRYVQVDGRLRRMGEGKEFGVKLDHAGNTLRLGRVEDIIRDHLDVSKPGEKGEAFKDEKPPKKPRECPECHAVIAPGQRSCPACGAMTFVSTVETVEGELVEFGSGKKAKPAVQATMFEKQAFYSGLLTLADQQGRVEGFAAHRYRDKFGVWPNQLQKTRGPVSEEVQRFDKYQRIKFIKGKQAEEKRAASLHEVHSAG